MDREKPKLEAHPNNKWTQNQEKTNGSNTKNLLHNELTQASDEPKIKAPSSSGYLHDQSLDDSQSRVSSKAHCIV